MFDNPKITEEMTKNLAGKAWFMFRVNLKDITGYEGFEGNDYMISGEGVQVLNHVLAAFEKFPRGRFILDYGPPEEEIIFEVGPANVQALLSAFTNIYGYVDKPDVWNVPTNLQIW